MSDDYPGMAGKGGSAGADIANMLTAAAGEAIKNQEGVSDADLEATRDGVSTSEADDGEAEVVESQEEVELQTDEVAEVETAEAVEDEVEEVVEVEDVEVEPSPVDTYLQELAASGVTIPVDRADLPAEAQPVFDTMVESMYDARLQAAHQILQAQEAYLAVQEFGQKLTEDPRDVLLTVAISNPEGFREAYETFEEMQTDERLRDLVVRELEVNASKADMDRRQKLQLQQAQTQQAQKLITHTRSVADKLGVDRAAAENMVAMAIKANGGIELGQIEEIVRTLRPKNTQKAVSAKKQKKVKQSDTQTVSDKTPATPKGDKQSDSNQGSGGHINNKFRDLIGDAWKRASVQG